MLTIVLSYSVFFLVAAYFYYVEIRHRINRFSARRDLAPAARELGLKRQGTGGLGTYRGKIDGYTILVAADEATISIKLKTRSDAWLLRTNWFEKFINGKSMEAAMSHLEAFTFANKDANRLFHYQFAPQRLAVALARAEAPAQLLADLEKKWRWAMGPLSLMGDTIRATPSRGYDKYGKSITGRQLREFIPGLIVLAKMWDQIIEYQSSESGQAAETTRCASTECPETAEAPSEPIKSFPEVMFTATPLDEAQAPTLLPCLHFP